MAEDNRTEQATPRRRWKAREKGQVARSQELAAALAMLSVIVLLGQLPQTWQREWRELTEHLLAAATRGEMTADVPFLQWTAAAVVRGAAPVVLVCWGVAVASLLAQGGFVFAASALVWKWERLNPAANLQRLLSLGALSRLLKSLLPTACLLYLFVSILTRDWGQLVHAARVGPRPSLVWMFERLFEVSWKAGLVFLFWSLLDYALQRLQFERQLRMTQQELRDEFKETEGHPMIRMRIRRLQRQMRRRRMVRDVSRATAVITNPTEYAVAIEYRPETMPAPVVLAKGRDRLAQMIKREARWHEIPVIENPPLAQALYRAVEVGQAIPAKLYAAVAEILAFVYRAQARARQNSDSFAHWPQAPAG